MREGAQVRVALQTALGGVVIEVRSDRAPLSSQAFMRYIEDGSFARNGGFYRVVRADDNDHGMPAIDVVQGGLLEGKSMLAGIAHEGTNQTGLLHVNGAVSLARAMAGTADGSAFFISLGDQPALDEGGARNIDRLGYAVLGRVIDGMDVVRKIHAMRTCAHDANPYRRGQVLERTVRFSSASCYTKR